VSHATYHPAMSLICVVTGANSGIGRATAIHLAREGHMVYGTVRDVERAAKLLSMATDAGVEVNLVELDVADDDSVANGFAQILAEAGHIDVLVNNAGVGGNAVVEECPPSMYLDMMNVNLCGAIRCAAAVLPGMRARGSGTIVNVTSVVGKFGSVGQAPYVASKWAFEGVSEELAHEVAPFGVRVVIVEPGITKSAIFAKNVDAPNSTGAYDAQYRRLFQFYAKGIAEATPAEEVAAVIHHAITTDEPRLRYRVSWGSEEIVAGRAAMSDEEWVALGAITDDAEYVAAFERYFSIDLA
jgi:NAD(P)-dependent dehydrogenase (short-subunit alcohol dehydrogenase family)